MSKSNRQYWADREQDLILHRIQDDKRMDKELEKLFKSALEDIQKEIDAFYGKYAQKNGLTLEEARKFAKRMDVQKFAKKAKEYVKKKDFSDKANEELELYNLKMRISRLELLQWEINLLLTGLYNDTEKYLIEEFYNAAKAEVDRQAGILKDSVSLSKKSIMELVNAGFPIGDFSDNIWKDKTLLQKQLNKIIQKAIVVGESSQKRANELAKACNTSLSSARRILRTEVGQIQIAQQKSNYEQHDIEYYQIITEPQSNKPCEVCTAFGEPGTSIDDAPIYKVSEMVSGVNAPLFHPNCRCSTVPFIE